MLGGHAVLAPLRWFCCHWVGWRATRREGCCSACATHTRSSSAPALPSTGLKAAPTAAGKGSLHRGVLVGSGLFSDPLTLQLLCVLLSRGVA